MNSSYNGLKSYENQSLILSYFLSFVKPKVHAKDFSRQIDQSSSADLKKSLKLLHLVYMDPNDFSSLSVPIQSEEFLQCRCIPIRNRNARITTSAKNSRNASMLRISRANGFPHTPGYSDAPMISDIPKSNRPAHQLPVEIPGRSWKAHCLSSSNSSSL